MPRGSHGHPAELRFCDGEGREVHTKPGADGWNGGTDHAAAYRPAGSPPSETIPQESGARNAFYRWQNREAVKPAAAPTGQLAVTR